MSSVAENLYSSAIESERAHRIKAGLIDALFTRFPVAQLITVLYAAVTVFVLRDAVPARIRFGWLGLLLVLTGARALMWRAYSRARPSVREAEPWGRWFAMGAGIAGVLWGSTAILFFVPGDLALQSFVAFTVGTMAIGSAVALGPFPPAFFSFAIPAVLLLAGSFIAEGGKVSIVIGMMAALLGAILVALAEFIYRSHERALKLRIENESLAGTLAVASEAAHAADLAKTAFLDSVSHELKTPLNAILGFSEILKDEMFGELGQPQYRDYAKLIHSSADHLLDVINEILEIAEAESGKLVLHESAVDVGHLVSICVGLVTARAGGRAATITVTIDKDLPKLRADPRRLRQILLNLLSNAIKFTPQGGRIEVRSAIEAQGSLILIVSDTGVGMSPEDLTQATRPFSRAHVGLSRKEPGVGTGLSLSKALVELHGGELMVESRLGSGTRVLVRFPKERVLGPR